MVGDRELEIRTSNNEMALTKFERDDEGGYTLKIKMKKVRKYPESPHLPIRNWTTVNYLIFTSVISLTRFQSGYKLSNGG